MIYDDITRTVSSKYFFVDTHPDTESHLQNLWGAPEKNLRQFAKIANIPSASLFNASEKSIRCTYDFQMRIKKILYVCDLENLDRQILEMLMDNIHDHLQTSFWLILTFSFIIFPKKFRIDLLETTKFLRHLNNNR